MATRRPTSWVEAMRVNDAQGVPPAKPITALGPNYVSERAPSTFVFTTGHRITVASVGSRETQACRDSRTVGRHDH